jgi:hypothetical protein
LDHQWYVLPVAVVGLIRAYLLLAAVGASL